MKKHSLTETHKKIIAGGGLLLFLIVMAAVFFFAGKPLVEFISQPEEFRSWVEEKGFAGKIIFMGMVILQVLVAIIPGEPFEIAAGYAFGMWEGTLLCLIAITLGSMMIFAFVRKFGVKAVEIFFSAEKIRSLNFLKSSTKRNALIFLIFFIPGTPKDLLTYFVGLTEIKPTTWLIISFIARIPSVITSTIGGNALGMQDYSFAILVFAGTLFLSGMGLLLYRKIKKNHERKETDQSS